MVKIQSKNRRMCPNRYYQSSNCLVITHAPCVIISPSAGIIVFPQVQELHHYCIIYVELLIRDIFKVRDIWYVQIRYQI